MTCRLYFLIHVHSAWCSTVCMASLTRPTAPAASRRGDQHLGCSAKASCHYCYSTALVPAPCGTALPSASGHIHLMRRMGVSALPGVDACTKSVHTVFSRPTAACSAQGTGACMRTHCMETTCVCSHCGEPSLRPAPLSRASAPLVSTWPAILFHSLAPPALSCPLAVLNIHIQAMLAAGDHLLAAPATAPAFVEPGHHDPKQVG